MNALEGQQWLHELRNAINTLCITSAVMNRMLAEGDAERVRALASELEAGCERCRRLMTCPPGELSSPEDEPLQ